MKKNQLYCGIAVLLSFSMFVACKKQDTSPADANVFMEKNPFTIQKNEVYFYALDNNNTLVKYSGRQTFREERDMMIMGLQAGELILAIDFRPATGQLYGVSNQSRIYVINPNTGAATAVNPTPFSPAINGAEVGFDFNPTVDRIRLITSSSQNLRLNPITGVVAAMDGNLNPGNPFIVAGAYTNSFAGATSTALYDIDASTDKLYIQNPPNNGSLVEIGSLGINAEGEGGFDISADNQLALAVLYGNGDDEDAEGPNGFHHRFYYIDLQTGMAKNAGKANRVITGIAIPVQ
ncbi:MAG TPA: DUF4394 domain-containing protein [Chitinophagaceae bacterium]|nr:DUF4394 domain-containing protein [Chitinophagaceae bacterium]